MEKNGHPIGFVKDTKPQSEGTVLKGWWADVLSPEEIDAPDKDRGYVNYSKPSKGDEPADITKKDEKYIRLAVEKYLQDNKKIYPISLMFLPDGKEIMFEDFNQNIFEEKGVWYIINPTTQKKEKLKDTWVEKNQDFLKNATADRFFNLKKQAVQSAIDAVWGKILFRAGRNADRIYKESKKPKPVVISSKYPAIQAVLNSVKDDVIRHQGRFLSKHSILKEYMEAEAVAHQYVKAGKGKPYDGQYKVAKDYYDFNGFNWDGLYAEMMKK